MPGLRSLSNRLAVIFALIVLGAVGTIYLSVTPRLEQSLTRQKIDGLVTLTKRYGEVLDNLPLALAVNDRKRLAKRIRRDAAHESAEILLLGVWHPPPRTGTFSIVDSAPDGGVSFLDVQGIAQRSLATRHEATGTQSTGSGRQAIAALPLYQHKRANWVLVFAGSLSDVQGNVSLIRRQVLISGAIALVIAVLAGWLVARALAARVKRLEQAARKVAAGDFSNPIRADSDDELGKLAAAFDDMQNQLARLDRARKQFIASASHELRTPIFSLGGFLELMADEDLDEETRRQFLEQEVREQVDRLGKLATDLLDLSRLEAGSLELRAEPTDVATICRMVAGEFAPAAAQRSSDLQLDLPSSPLEATCDPERLAQIMRILIDNALRHTPDRTNVVISAARNGAGVRVAVVDAGPGIKRAELERVFEPFYTSDDQRGSGLGLAIARELAERMHGQLGAASTPGRTTFSLELPT